MEYLKNNKIYRLISSITEKIETNKISMAKGNGNMCVIIIVISLEKQKFLLEKNNQTQTEIKLVKLLDKTKLKAR